MDEATGEGASKADRARKRSPILTLIALAGCGVALAWVYRSASEARRPVTRWAREVRSGDVEERRVAARQLADSGMEDVDVALPALVSALSDEDEQVRADVAANLGTVGINALQAKGKEAEVREVARALAGCLRDEGPNVKMSAALAFGEFAALTKGKEFPADPSAVAASLADLLPDPSPMVRGPAEGALIRIAGQSPIEPSKALLEGVTAWPLAESRASAAIALGAFQAGHGPTVEALARALLDKSPLVRGAAAAGLDRIGPDAAPALPALAGVLADPHVPPPPPEFLVRFQGVGPGAPAGGVGSVNEADPATQAAQAIGRIAQARGDKAVAVPEGVVDALVKASKAERPALRDAAQEALRRIGKGASAAIPALIGGLAEASAKAEPGQGPAAAALLGDIARGTDAAGGAIQALTSALDAKAPAIRSAAARALGRFGPAASAALARLRALGDGPDQDLAREARLAADRVEGKAPPEPARRKGQGRRGQGSAARN